MAADGRHMVAAAWGQMDDIIAGPFSWLRASEECVDDTEVWKSRGLIAQGSQLTRARTAGYAPEKTATHFSNRGSKPPRLIRTSPRSLLTEG
ncbi:unnamed protein product [Arctogadus glacialis]